MATKRKKKLDQYDQAGIDSIPYTLALTMATKKNSAMAAGKRDPYIPKTPEAWMIEGGNLKEPSQGWKDLIAKEGKKAGYQGAKGTSKTIKYPPPKKKKTAKKPSR